jgi:hypothetical protein
MKIMKKILILFIFIIILTGSNLYAKKPDFELLLDLQGYEYSKLLTLQKITAQDPELNIILKFGKRNLLWLEHINKFRDDKLSFSTQENILFSSISNPRVSNKEIVLDQFNELLNVLPIEMKEIILNNKPFTDEPPLAVENYLYYGFKIDTIYQSAARLILLLPYIEHYKAERAKDIRGFYNLQHLADLNEKLKNYTKLNLEEQKYISNNLLNLCYNTEENDAKCLDKFKKSLEANQNDASFFYSAYVAQAQKIYNDFFIIKPEARRKDIKWEFNSDPQKTIVPFSNKNINEPIKEFLQNIELEWRWGNWQLTLEYISADNIPYIEFKPGVTPHVDKLGGNNIVMDANQPLTEWLAKWTIRHEFGHVLGFPDCYIEFYDDSTKAFISYPIDTTNLMCSRKGKLKKSHYLEMQRQYALT